MSDFMYAAGGWNNPPHRTSLSHLRTASSSNTIKSSPKLLAQRPVSKSTSMSVLNSPSRMNSYNNEDRDMSTIPDPRSRSMTPANDSTPPSPAQHPDLNDEVATLSTKLINAINHQTNLDDTLSATRQELDQAKEEIRRLESANKEYTEALNSGSLLRKSNVDSEKARLNATIEDERRQRAEVEKQKKGIEQELENLSVALFEEAQKMVITEKEEAQKEHDLLQKRNDQLKAQLVDTEGLLKFQQDQLAELKQVLEQMREEKDDQTNPTAPSTPAAANFESREATQDSEAPQVSSVPDAVVATYPTNLTHLIQMSLRTDLSTYDDFVALLQMSKNVPAGSRVSSGSYGSIGLGLGLGGYATTMPSNGSSTSLSTAAQGSGPVTPTTPASTTSTASTNGPNALTPLKETKFYKRSYVEDIEPTMRLETAPGLSWLARRNVLQAVNEGTMMVEPIPSTTKTYNAPCTLCGEARRTGPHARTHRFRTSESESAQRYLLCRYCLGRVRSTCDFIGFLRILKDGHWRADDAESEKSAWEESVRLREQMFWCRIGGGVIPASAQPSVDLKSPRVSAEERKDEEAKLSEEIQRTGEIQPKDVTRLSGADSKRSSLISSRPQSRIGTAPELVNESVGTDVPSTNANAYSPGDTRTSKVDNSHVEAEDSNRVTEKDEVDLTTMTSAKDALAVQAQKDEPKRLSLTIPGSFD